MTDTPPAHGPTRRELLGGLLGGLGLAAASPLQRTAQAVGRRRAVSWTLRAAPTSYTFPTGTALPFFRLQHAGPGTTLGLIPLVEATEGQSVLLQIENQLSLPVRPSMVGVADGDRIWPGQTRQFAFTMPSAGSYLIGLAPTGRGGPGGPLAVAAQRPMSGFSALAISRPATGANELWSGGPPFDREYFLLYEDADDRWNAAMTNPMSLPASARYEPNYFMVNGRSYPDIASDPSSRVIGNLGDRILIRMGNLGRLRQAIHFHGFHPEVVARNNVHETSLGQKDTVPVPSRTTTDVILTASQVGDYPVHPHSLTAVTANGFYPLGQLTLVSIS